MFSPVQYKVHHDLCSRIKLIVLCKQLSRETREKIVNEDVRTDSVALAVPYEGKEVLFPRVLKLIQLLAGLKLNRFFFSESFVTNGMKEFNDLFQ